MESTSPLEDESITSKHSLGTWARIYLHGFIALAAFAAVAYLVVQLVPLFDFTGHRYVAIFLCVTAILAGPPIIGSIILYIVFPILGKKEAWRGLLAWDDRLISEVSSAKHKAQIVIIPWPSPKVRTIGVLTASFQPDNGGQQLAAVYVPTAPQTKLGYIRIVPLSEIEYTGWTFKQWQLYQFTFGAVSPDSIAESDAGTSVNVG